MNALISMLLIAASWSSPLARHSPQVKANDFKIVAGAGWIGTLSYLDYGRNKTVSIPSRLSVSRSTTDKRTWLFSYEYPEEPKENALDTVTVSTDGVFINDKKVVERGELPGNSLKIVAEKAGLDNDKRAVFRYTYMIGRKAFSIRKEVRYEATTEFFVRNEYSWTR